MCEIQSEGNETINKALALIEKAWKMELSDIEGSKLQEYLLELNPEVARFFNNWEDIINFSCYNEGSETYWQDRLARYNEIDEESMKDIRPDDHERYLRNKLPEYEVTEVIREEDYQKDFKVLIWYRAKVSYDWESQIANVTDEYKLSWTNLEYDSSMCHGEYVDRPERVFRVVFRLDWVANWFNSKLNSIVYRNNN